MLQLEISGVVFFRKCVGDEVYSQFTDLQGERDGFDSRALVLVHRERQSWIK